MKFRYDGPFDAVELDGYGLVVRGHQVEVHGPAAESLSRQSDWSRVDKPKPRTAAAAVDPEPPADVAEPNEE